MKKIFLGLFVGLFLTAPMAARAEEKAAQQGQQMLCNERSKVLEHLAENYTEAPMAIGMAENGGIVEVLTSNDSSTWTILMTMPNGVSCLVAMGNSWEMVQRVAIGPGA